MPAFTTSTLTFTYRTQVNRVLCVLSVNVRVLVVDMNSNSNTRNKENLNSYRT